jgi:hypothetical protein
LHRMIRVGLRSGVRPTRRRFHNAPRNRPQKAIHFMEYPNRRHSVPWLILAPSNSPRNWDRSISTGNLVTTPFIWDQTDGGRVLWWDAMCSSCFRQSRSCKPRTAIGRIRSGTAHLGRPATAKRNDYAGQFPVRLLFFARPPTAVSKCRHRSLLLKSMRPKQPAAARKNSQPSSG